MESIKIPSQDAAQLTATVEKYVGVCTAYVFGRYFSHEILNSVVSEVAEAETRITHYFVLVFTDKTRDGLYGTMADAIARDSEGRMRAVFLLHRLKSLAAPAPDMHCFFGSILRFGYRLCIDTQNVPFLNSPAAVARVLKAARSYWYKCDAVASYYLESAAESRRIDVELIRVALLSQAMEYVALGLIRVFMGYTPNQYSLRLLLELCGQFTDLPRLFDGIAQSDGPLLKQLFAPPSMLRHWDRLEMAEDRFHLLRLACAAFLDKARSLALCELQRLENDSKALSS